MTQPRIFPLRRLLATSLLAACSTTRASGGPALGEGAGTTHDTTFQGAALGEITPRTPYFVPAGEVTFTPEPQVPAAQVDLTLGEGDACTPIRWSIEGPAASPARATGPTFHTVVSAPGTYTVTATCGRAARRAAFHMCDYAGDLSAAAAYYGKSIDIRRVVVSFERTLTGASWTAHEHVRIGNGVLDDTGGCPDAAHYVHELGHVWEYEHGQGQLTRGAIDQVVNLVHDVYDFGGPDAVRAALQAGRGIDSFNLEQEAEIFATDFDMRRQAADDPYAKDLAALTRPALAQPPSP